MILFSDDFDENAVDIENNIKLRKIRPDSNAGGSDQEEDDEDIFKWVEENVGEEEGGFTHEFGAHDENEVENLNMGASSSHISPK